MKRNPFRYLVTTVVTMAIGLLGIGSFAAADTNTATIDPTKETSLTIHKYEGPAVNCKDDGGKDLRNGTDISDNPCLAGKQKLAGAEFTVWKVTDVDLTNNKGWQDAKDYFASNTRPTNLGTPVAVTTDANGVAAFTGLEVGLYYVGETKAPPAANGATYTPAAPFFVTLPMTNPAKGAWMYDVHVFPKNTKSEKPHKTVIDVDTRKVGDKLDYRVSHAIPAYSNVVGAPGSDGKLTGPDAKVDRWDVGSYYIGDRFPDSLKNVSVTKVSIIASDADPTTFDGTPIETLVAGTDYVLQQNDNLTNVALIGTGLDKFAANPGAQILVEYSTTIASIPDSGQIVNEAWVVPGPTPQQGGTPPTPPTPGTPPEEPPTPDNPTNKVISKYGKIRIHKVGITSKEDTNRVDLPNVTFEVYQAKATKNSEGAWEYSCARADVAGQTALDTFTTGTGGLGESAMLRLSNWYNDGVERAADGNNNGYLDGAQYANKYGHLNYCLVEVKAADGYQLLAEPVMIPLTVPGASAEVAPTEIVNQKDNIGNELPFTGGQGIAFVSIAGLVLIGGGLAYYLITSRRREA